MSSQNGLYLYSVAPPLEVRRLNFARYMERVVGHAKMQYGWSVTDIAKRAGIGPNTIYRWINGSWEKDGPKPDQLVAFCDALEISPQEAFATLWPGKNEATPTPEPFVNDPDLMLLMRKLIDPNVPESEKFFIQETLRQLAARPDRPTGSRPIRRTRPTRKSS